MVEILIEYEGEFRCNAVHTTSRSILKTDAPLDNYGKAENFSPTDLVAAALGTCIATVMGIYAERHKLSLKGMTVRVEKHMKDGPRRIGKLAVDIDVPLHLDEKRRKTIEAVAHTCPVHNSLHPEIETIMLFHYKS